MSAVSPAELFRKAATARYAIPAINVSNMETIQAAVAAAERASAPIILQVSPGAIAYAGYNTLRTMAFRAAERASVPVVVHLDHCRDPELVTRALADGFPSVMFDGSALGNDENVRQTAAVAVEAHRCGAIVEGELGVIGGSEAMTLEQAMNQRSSPAEAADFVRQTSVDILAPALGNLHRMPDDSVVLDLGHVEDVASAAQVPLALHGASGIDRRQLPALVAAGVAKVNLSSRVGRAFADGIRRTWESSPEQVDLRAYLGAGRAAVERTVTEYLRMCGTTQRADANGLTTEWSEALVDAE